ncbi:MAG: ParB/RepB/Spo0J family partition protein [Clostridiales bacterium]|nr:ParB/RepB/Spo0J family partition protein [Clostridiales bacterium]
MKKKGLGRSAVFGEDFSLETITTQTHIDKEYIHQLPVNKIDVNKAQPRKTFNKETIEALAQSIKENGMLQPITVQKTGDRYEIIAGERRYRAVRFLEMETIPAIIKELSPQKVCQLALIENLQREDLNPIEAAAAIKALMEDFNLTQQEVSEKIGTSRPNIANALRLLKLPESVQNLIMEGKISSGHGRAFAVLEDEKVIILLANKCVEEGWSVRQAEQKVKSLINEKQPKKKKEKKRIPEFDIIEDNMRMVMGTKVKINGNDKKGKIEIDYYNRDDLERIIAILCPEN